jgi:hypothetical protein
MKKEKDLFSVDCPSFLKPGKICFFSLSMFFFGFTKKIKFSVANLANFSKTFGFVKTLGKTTATTNFFRRAKPKIRPSLPQKILAFSENTFFTGILPFLCFFQLFFPTTKQNWGQTMRKQEKVPKISHKLANDNNISSWTKITSYVVR